MKYLDLDPKELCRFIQSIQVPLAKLLERNKEDDDVFESICGILNSWGVLYETSWWVYKGQTDCSSVFIIGEYAVWKNMVYTLKEFKKCSVMECSAGGSDQEEISL